MNQYAHYLSHYRGLMTLFKLGNLIDHYIDIVDGYFIELVLKEYSLS